MKYYRQDIDGLRAIAVTSVVLFHATLTPFSGGFVGVDVFFVISGFLIGDIVNREAAEGRFSFTTFYARRARRILPALVAVTLVTLAICLVLLETGELRGYLKSGLFALLGLSNIHFFLSSDYFAARVPLRPLPDDLVPGRRGTVLRPSCRRSFCWSTGWPRAMSSPPWPGFRPCPCWAVCC